MAKGKHRLDTKWQRKTQYISMAIFLAALLSVIFTGGINLGIEGFLKGYKHNIFVSLLLGIIHILKTNQTFLVVSAMITGFLTFYLNRDVILSGAKRSEESQETKFTNLQENILLKRLIQYTFLTALLLAVLLFGVDLGIENFLKGYRHNIFISLLLGMIHILKTNQTFLVVSAIVTGFLVFYLNRNETETNLETESIEEEKEEEKRRKEFPEKFPKINKIPLLRNIIRWCYKEGWWYSLGLFIIVLIGFWLRIWNLGKLSLWGDEGIVYIAVKNILNTRLPYLETGLLYLRDLPHLYITSASVAMFGHTEFALRLPSVIAGTLLIIFLYLLAKELFGKDVALIVALISAVFPWIVEYSRISRSYILMVLLITISFYFLVRFLKEKNTRFLVLFTLFSFVTALTHQTGQILLLTVIPLSLTILSWKMNLKEKFSKITLISIPYVFIFFSIILYKFLFSKSFYFFADERTGSTTGSLLKYIPFGIPNLDNISLFNDILPIYWPLSIITLSLGLIFIRRLNDRNKLLIGSMVIFILALIFSQEDVTTNRPVLFLFPFIVLTFGLLLNLLTSILKVDTSRKSLFVVFLLLPLLHIPGSLNITFADYGDPIYPRHSFFEGWIFRQDNKTMYQYVNEHHKDGDIIMVYGNEQWALLYSDYPIDYKVWSSDTTATIDNTNLYSGVREVRTIEEVQDIIDNNKRIWVITTYSIFSRTEKAPRTFHLSNSLLYRLSQYDDKIVYQSKDPAARVYLIDNQN